MKHEITCFIIKYQTFSFVFGTVKKGKCKTQCQMLSAKFKKELESLLYKTFFCVTAEKISVIMSCAHVATYFSGI